MSKLSSSLHPQDVLVACKMFSLKLSDEEWTYAGLGESVGISAGEAHNAMDRCRRSSIIGTSGAIVRKHLRDLLTVAAPRIFYASRGGITRGMPTGLWAPPLVGKFEKGSQTHCVGTHCVGTHCVGTHCVGTHCVGTLPTAWPCEDGTCERGESVDPIYPSAPVAARDPLVYELLALVDVIRIGGATDRNRAIEMIDRRMSER